MGQGGRWRWIREKARRRGHRIFKFWGGGAEILAHEVLSFPRKPSTFPFPELWRLTFLQILLFFFSAQKAACAHSH